MKKLLCTMLLALVWTSVPQAADLYKAVVSDNGDAELLRSAGVEPVYRIAGGYLVLTDGRTADDLRASGVGMTFLTSGVDIDRLAVDNRFDRSNTDRFDLVFEQDQLRIYRVDDARKALSADGSPLVPVDNRGMRIEYYPQEYFNERFQLGEAPLDSLIDLVSADSGFAYVSRLQAFDRRVAGTDSLRAARDWVFDKFKSFGYDSVVVDSFPFGSSNTGYNVVAYKIGTRFPGRQIIVGGHYDAVLAAPGADDNGSGTAGTLEIARVLKDIETEMTFIFIAFDGEEVGLLGSTAYASAAYNRGDSIIYMLDMDMIGHINNVDTANLRVEETNRPYAQLWGRLADSLLGMVGIVAGYSGGSDHAPFYNRGYNYTFVQEFHFSPNWHQPTDSTSRMSFDYMAKMIKGSLAMVYAVNLALTPVYITSIQDVGDGQSLKLTWGPSETGRIDHYWLYWTTDPPTQPDSIQIPADSSSYVIGGLNEGQPYLFHIIPVDSAGRTAVSFREVRGTPQSRPAIPENLAAWPMRESIKLVWKSVNTELDFSHFGVIRDGALLPSTIFDTVYVDGVAAQDTTVHDYLVVAVDTDDNISDTAGAPHVSMKAAQLAADRILAVNRSASNSAALVNESVTGEFMREALGSWDYTYLSDTAASNPIRANLMKMIDYGLVVIGKESGKRQDEIGSPPISGGILEDIAYYLSIGGKVIIFGRWGDYKTLASLDTIFYSPLNHTAGYINYFNIAYRLLPITVFRTSDTTMISDFVGAKSHLIGYPDLVWDSLASVNHTANGYKLTGIPCPGYPYLIGSNFEVLYTYTSSDSGSPAKDQPIAWRYLGQDYQYVFFEIPLSFMQREAAAEALAQAVRDMGIISDVADDGTPAVLPSRFALSQNYPNPFNPTTIIEFFNPYGRPVKATLEVFNILGQRVAMLMDGPAAPGLNRVEWNGRDGSGKPAATGIYFYRLKTDKDTLTRKMVLLK